MGVLVGILGMATLYGFIIYAVRGTLLYAGSHAPKRKYKDAICELYKAGYSRVYFFMGMVSIALYAIIFSQSESALGANTANIKAGFLAFIAFLFLVSYRFHCWHFIVIDGRLLYQNMLGSAQEIPMSELSGYKTGDDQELIIYRNGKKFIVIEDGDNKYEAMWGLSKYKVPCLNENTPTYTVCASRQFLLFMAGCSAVLGGMVCAFGFLGPDGPIEGLEVLGIAITIGLIIHFYKKFGVKVRVEEKCFYVKRPFQNEEEKIPFAAIRKVRTEADGDDITTAHYSFYLQNNQIAFKVMRSSKNVNRLEELIHKIKWLKKK